jgi:hypothetical protein
MPFAFSTSSAGCAVYDWHTRVMYYADVGHGVRRYGVESCLGEIEGKCEDLEQSLAKGIHGVVVAVNCWAPEEC